MLKVVTDTSCLIALGNCGILQLLPELYGDVFMTEEVADEFGAKPEWLQIGKLKSPKLLQAMNILVDRGEASTIAFALEQRADLVLMDDLAGRKLLGRFNMNFCGTLGVLVAAKERGKLASVKPALEKLKANNFRMEASLEAEILKRAGEL